MHKLLKVLTIVLAIVIVLFGFWNLYTYYVGPIAPEENSPEQAENTTCEVVLNHCSCEFVPRIKDPNREPEIECARYCPQDAMPKSMWPKAEYVNGRCELLMN